MLWFRAPKNKLNNIDYNFMVSISRGGRRRLHASFFSFFLLFPLSRNAQLLFFFRILGQVQNSPPTHLFVPVQMLALAAGAANQKTPARQAWLNLSTHSPPAHPVSLTGIVKNNCRQVQCQLLTRACKFCLPVPL